MSVRSSLLPSSLETAEIGWLSCPDYYKENLSFTSTVFLSVSNALLRNPNLNSTHLFRADILWDSTGELRTPGQLEQQHETNLLERYYVDQPSDVEVLAPTNFQGFSLERTVVRRLIPRKPQVDKALDQTCHFYKGPTAEADCTQNRLASERRDPERWLLVYNPHVSAEADMPWYHPPVRAIAYMFDQHPPSTDSPMTSSLSLHMLPLKSVPLNPVPDRLHRTFLSLLSTFLRLGRSTPKLNSTNGEIKPSSNPLKDTIVPQHLHQNTYSRLKEIYAAKLIADWVEKTEPSKHVFEDLSIAAFLMELWRQMYGIRPSFERDQDKPADFPGFVDIACGNGVLVYILISEGYRGWGFDARTRKTWAIFPKSVQAHLKELLCIPKPFRSALPQAEPNAAPTHDGLFPKDTFIISNHADELTPWTPILAALSCPAQPLPFLAIPCCSHALSGAKHRYPPPKPSPEPSNTNNTTQEAAAEEDEPHDPPADSQPQTGDLKALRAQKTTQQHQQLQNPTSTYSALCAHISTLSSSLSYTISPTLMRIPSTRNIGLLGRHRSPSFNTNISAEEELSQRIEEVVQRECRHAGGVETAARLWRERGEGLRRGQGRGRVKGGRVGH